MTHHAYIYEGPADLLDALVESARVRFGYTSEHQPDLYVRSYERFGIDDARELLSTASMKSSQGRALFILGVEALGSEAQQALLKLFEEPQPGVIFILLVPPGIVLDTVRSRMLPYPEALTGEVTTTDARAFLSWPYKKRSDWITAFLKPARPDDSGRSGGDEGHLKERTRAFINELEQVLHAALPKASSARARDVREGLEDIAHFRSYLGDTAPSLKMILEHFAATLPQVE